jgi:EAL domain-containing protein (putative c-di-GMP-specific phosphodiesterase class I)/FixJ family two-component response regulator
MQPPPPGPGDQAAEHSVYILDDEPHVAQTVAAVLGTCGFASRQFTAPAPFLRELDIASPAVIVLDLALGQSDAVDIIRRLESRHYKGKILLISGRDEATLAEIAAIGKRHGMQMLPPLRKPFRAKDIKERLVEQPAESQSHVDERPPESEAKSPPKPAPNTAPKTEARAPRKIAVQVTEALRKKWLELWYQPVIDLATLTVCGAEGLLRAHHSEFGILGPDHILPPAGDPAYMPLTRFVLECAVRDWTRFANHGLSLDLGINVPISVIASPDFVAALRAILPTDARFPGLTIEVTEDEVARDPQWMQEIATQLALYNVRIAIDNFGRACASLSRIHDLHVVELKIDRDFVSGCASNPSRRSLCQTVVDLAHRFGAKACAKGVETAADLRALIDMKVDRAQGFLFADPMPAHRLTQKLLAGHGQFASRTP